MNVINAHQKVQEFHGLYCDNPQLVQQYTS